MTTDGVITRHDTSDQGTFGRLDAGLLSLYTGELPWRENASSVSCIRPGPGEEPQTYWAQVTYSPKFGRGLYLLADTRPRSSIRVHPANLAGDKTKGYRCQLNGCIALGEKLGWLDGQKAVLVSQPAVRRLQQYFHDQPFQLTIKWI